MKCAKCNDGCLRKIMLPGRKKTKLLTMKKCNALPDCIVRDISQDHPKLYGSVALKKANPEIFVSFSMVDACILQGLFYLYDKLSCKVSLFP